MEDGQHRDKLPELLPACAWPPQHMQNFHCLVLQASWPSFCACWLPVRKKNKGCKRDHATSPVWAVGFYWSFPASAFVSVLSWYHFLLPCFCNIFSTGPCTAWSQASACPLVLTSPCFRSTPFPSCFCRPPWVFLDRTHPQDFLILVPSPASALLRQPTLGSYA